MRPESRTPDDVRSPAEMSLISGKIRSIMSSFECIWWVNRSSRTRQPGAGEIVDFPFFAMNAVAERKSRQLTSADLLRRRLFRMGSAPERSSPRGRRSRDLRLTAARPSPSRRPTWASPCVVSRGRFRTQAGTARDRWLIIVTTRAASRGMSVRRMVPTLNPAHGNATASNSSRRP